MAARIGRERGGTRGSARGSARAAEEGREIALDLTPSEVVLHEGSPRQGWRRFAGVTLDDREFREVIGLLRAEAESELGPGRPVRLWLPGDQVLRLSVRIEEREPRARLGAAFRHAARATGQAGEDLAVALGPEGPGGEATVLVTYAATWREARDYAARWGFVPGPVSTRHHAEAFGDAGPEFRLEGAAHEEGVDEGEPCEADEPAPRRLAWLAVVLATVLCSTLPAMAASPAPLAAPVPLAAPLAEGRGADAGGAGGESTEAAPEATAAGDDGSAGEQREASGAVGAAATRPGGLTMPLPARRPERGPAPEAAAPARGVPAPAVPALAVPAPGVAATAPVFLPPVRPPGLAERAAKRLDRVLLLGILDLDTGREALLRLADGDFVTVSAGEAVYGWEVGKIDRAAILVRRGSESRTLTLLNR